MIMPPSRNERLSIRVPTQVKELLVNAAATRHKTLSDFVLDTAVSEAETVLASRRAFSLSPAAWEEFQAALDAPPQRHARMERLLNEPSVFDPLDQ
jgi:uncharacterized protein (DUF1778 family)